MASIGEIALAVETAKRSGCKDLVLLKCTSSYPASPSNANILTIPHLRELFNCEVGLSDHTMGIGVALAAVAHGASVIEKHFTLSRKDGGVDSSFSLEPDELASLVVEVDRAWQSLGEVKYEATDSEVKNQSLRRSIYASCQIAKGEIFTTDNIRIVRPGRGAHPKYYSFLIGMVSYKDYNYGDPIEFGSDA
jgi:sialic acid synthase SpsE